MNQIHTSPSLIVLCKSKGARTKGRFHPEEGVYQLSWKKGAEWSVLFPVLCVFLGAMAVTTLRMKFLWTPYVCLLASVCVSDYTAYKWLCTRFLKTTEAKVRPQC